MRGAGWYLLVVLAVGANCAQKASPRLPRTSAGQFAAAAAAQNKTSSQLRNAGHNKTVTTTPTTIGPPPGRGASSRSR
ncbi:hypothetical protein QE152_g15654 [Popillia japonica]|uniref:Secreted protein n=1 Tax=Popillia japonica TaxID=7064 RepID=A0AAW1L7B3_POPJA